jgi:hypothetical protein
MRISHGSGAFRPNWLCDLGFQHVFSVFFDDCDTTCKFSLIVKVDIGGVSISLLMSVLLMPYIIALWCKGMTLHPWGMHAEYVIGRCITYIPQTLSPLDRALSPIVSDCEGGLVNG